MVDILLDRDGDIKLSPAGDILTTASVRQAILIRLRWILAEWRLGPDLGFPWFEEVLIKNPDLGKLRQLIRNEVMQVPGVTAATVKSVKYDPAKRSVSVAYTCAIGDEIFEEEAILYG